MARVPAKGPYKSARGEVWLHQGANMYLFEYVSDEAKPRDRNVHICPV